jgi:dolichyl-phosphate beta-glucosyltransferase
MTSPPTLVLVVPCFNEAARLDGPAFLGFAASHPAARLLFVNDGSDDGTPGILDRLKEQAPGRVDVVSLPARQGKGEAVRQGILEALKQPAALVGFWDADLATPLSAVDDFLALASVRPDIDVILGSRVMLMGRDIRRQAWRHYLGRVFATGVSLALDLPVYDTQCGAKMFRVNDVTPALFTRPCRSKWIFDVELLARYLAQPVAPGEAPRRARIYELTVRAWRHVPGSKLRATDYFRAIFELAAIRRELR